MNFVFYQQEFSVGKESALNQNLSYTSYLLKHYKSYILKNILLSVVYSFLTLLCPYLLRAILDKNSPVLNGHVLALYLFLFCLSYVTKYILDHFELRYGRFFKIEEGKHIFEKMFRMKYQKFIELEPSYLVEKLTTTLDTIFLLFSQAISSVFISFLSIFTTLTILFFINRTIFLLFFLLLPLYYFAPKKLNQSLGERSRKMQTVVAKCKKDILSIVSNPEFVKQESGEGLIGILDGKLTAIQQEHYEVNRFAKDFSLVINFCMTLITNITNIYVILLFSQGKLALSDMVFIQLVSSIYVNSLSSIIDINITIRDLKGALYYVEQELDENREEDGERELDSISCIHVDVKGIGFEKCLIEKGRFTAFKGEVIGIIGDSGTGKSTLMKTLLKFYDFKEIRIDGIPISDIRNDSLRKKIYLVPQTPYIIPGTIKENILLGRKENSAAWRRVKEMDFLRKFAATGDGLDAEILENGANLSGGDKQRILLARLFLENPDVIILDESICSLDQETGDQILGKICDHFRDKIVFIIAHNDYPEKYNDKVDEIKDKEIVCSIKQKQA